MTVGVLEQLDASLSVMECLMTDFLKVYSKTFVRAKNLNVNILTAFFPLFQGLSSIQRLENNHENSNSDKGFVSEEVRRVMRSRLHPEYILYDYVVSRLAVQRRRCNV